MYINKAVRGILIVAVVLGGVWVLQVDPAWAGCDPGEFNDGGTCEPCPAGSFCDGGSAPTPCPPGTNSKSGAAFCSPISQKGGGFNPDADDDGIDHLIDNCPFTANPSQLDTWGGHQGNACDPNYYDNGDGVKIFRLKPSGIYQVFSDCEGTICQLIAEIDPRDFAGLGQYPPDFLRYHGGEDGRWFVDVYLLGEDEHGNKAYQVNVYAPGGLLLDDGFLLFVAPDGSDFFIPHN